MESVCQRRHGLPGVFFVCFACLDVLGFFLGHQQVVSLRLTLKFHVRVGGRRLPRQRGLPGS